jgi:hypothetical protein
VWGRKGGDQDGQKGKRATTRVSLQEKRNDATDDSDLASNDPQPFSPIHALKINLWSTFFEILQGFGTSTVSARLGRCIKTLTFFGFGVLATAEAACFLFFLAFEMDSNNPGIRSQ